MAEITGDQHVQSEVLEGLATAVNHRRWFAELALPYLGSNPIEIGSGLGKAIRDFKNAFSDDDSEGGTKITEKQTSKDLPR